MLSDNPFIGTWTYRSFRNVAEHLGDVDNPVGLEKLKAMLFAEADIIIEDSPVGSLAGKLDMGETGILHLKGATSFGNPFTARFQGVGTAGTPKGWVYDYIAYLVPIWPNGIDQSFAMVGSVIRTVPHSNGQAKAGYVASFIAVKRV
jgi:hypothetical protein